MFGVPGLESKLSYLDKEVKEHMVKMKNWVGKGAVCLLCDNECGVYIVGLSSLQNSKSRNTSLSSLICGHYVNAGVIII